MSVLKLKSLRKAWGDLVTVDGIDLEIGEGEFFVLLGPSGCGKSTILRMIAGLDEITSGTVEIGNRVVNDILPKDRNISMVFQNYGLYPHMTIRDNIGYTLKVRKFPAAEHDGLIRKAAEKVKMTDYLDRMPRQLSGGQRQRVALARAIVRAPQVFLMDEPLSNLDAKLRAFMRSEIKHLQFELKVTTVYVTHDQIEAMTLADRVAVMNKGKIIQIGTPQRIYHDPDHIFTASFIGSPPMNLIRGKLLNGTFMGDSIECGPFGDTTRENITLGVRAEDVQTDSVSSGEAMSLPIYSIEKTGEASLVYFELPSEEKLIVRADNNYPSGIGSNAPVFIDPDKIYFFDTESGNRLRDLERNSRKDY